MVLCESINPKLESTTAAVAWMTMAWVPAGAVERTNKLVGVRAIGMSYDPKIGDLVVGRITESYFDLLRCMPELAFQGPPRRWGWAQASQDAALMLPSINPPDSFQEVPFREDWTQTLHSNQTGLNCIRGEIRKPLSSPILLVISSPSRYDPPRSLRMGGGEQRGRRGLDPTRHL